MAAQALAVPLALPVIADIPLHMAMHSLLTAKVSPNSHYFAWYPGCVTQGTPVLQAAAVGVLVSGRNKLPAVAVVGEKHPAFKFTVFAKCPAEF